MSFLIQARFKLMSFVVQQDLEWTSSPFGRLSEFLWPKNAFQNRWKPSNNGFPNPNKFASGSK